MSSESGMTSLLDSDVIVEMKDFFSTQFSVKMNWIKVFDYASGLFAGAFTELKEGGCGIYLFKIDTKTGIFTQVLNLLNDEGDSKLIRNHLGI